MSDHSLDQTSVKTCKQCRTAKPVSSFPKQDKVRRKSTCKDCYNERRRLSGAHLERGPRETSEERRARLLRKEYGISPEQYTALVASQNGACAICKKTPERLVVDHCHATDVVRALLCTYCNVIVGIYENHHRAAAEYLAAYGNGNPLLDQ
jgi:hypothetical protein